MKGRRWILLLVAAPLILRVATEAQQLPSVAERKPPPDAPWMADAEVADASVMTDDRLGAGQGVALRDGKVYAYGDVWKATPRVGVIREYDRGLKPTGREVWLSSKGVPVILHPTGLTWDARFGTFLGDTVNKKARIFRLDWERAWRDGNLDASVLDTIDDDAAVNGCRPEFVTLLGRSFLATADYGDVRPEIRLLDPEALLRAGRSSVPGVIVHRILAGSWNQSLHWDQESSRLICVQNVIEGRGWRLDSIRLSEAVADGRAWGPGVRAGIVTFDPHDELEGFCLLDHSRGLFITSSPSKNLVSGIIRATEPRISPPPARPLP